MGVYEMTRGRWSAFFAFGISVVFAVLAAVLWGRGLGEPNVALGIAAVVWTSLAAKTGWSLLRLSHRIDVGTDGLRWTTPLRSGEVAFDDITAVEQGGRRRYVKVRHSGTPVLVPPGQGITALVAAIRARRPDLAEPDVLEPAPSSWRPPRATWVDR